ncbi:DsbA family protein [Pseudoduganella eburnea]|uniref:DsbA family protein n=1 Tax=Massilia eburnea TaxID=1776165 RepID=A0A6L6QFS0_9BURK|nr:DsbA family protein [Massilia eburnea]MTW10717.1 DsbA family protein [Massilia eburnea]
MKLIYVGDPMCSWCYGFGKEMTALKAMHPDLQIEIVLGGLRAGGTELLTNEGKQFRLMHWARVEAASGLPFNREAFMKLENFVYDTEPVCRAVVTARRLHPNADVLAVFRALQHAFYAEGRNTTDGRILSEVGAEELRRQGFEVSNDAYFAEFSKQATIDEAHRDFSKARKLGVSSFPALLLDTGKEIVEVSPGYAHAEQLDQQLRTAMAR